MMTIQDLQESGATSHRVSATPALREGEWHTLFEADGPGLITHLWFTFPSKDEMLGRRNLLRMYWDGEDEPSVEAPLSDFFGLPFGFTGLEYKLSSHYLVVAPRNGLNCYFPMPFGRHARIEILSEQLQSGGGFYFQADTYRFGRGLPDAYLASRFHAQFRFENPCENYGRNYLFVDAAGTGALVGATFGVTANDPQLDSWYHGGGDSIFVDGETRPNVLHGIGAEDFFGHSWGVQEFQSPYVGTPLLELDEDGKFRRTSVYRFMVHDPVMFDSSIRGVLGAMANGYSSVAYWYQTEPHRPFFRTPEADARMPDSVAPYGTHDVEPDHAAEWQLLAPFRVDDAEPFETERPFESAETGEEAFVYAATGNPTRPGGEQMEVRWVPQTPRHNFVDFHTVARPAIRTIALQVGVVGYALKYIDSDVETNARVFLGFDDEAAVRVNGSVAFEGRHPAGFREASFTVPLRKGRNRVLVKLSNRPNTTWKLWAFSFRISA
ncbi:MAG: DUF2961 domain-containing protein [Candidatus Latescibacteria bacterium]|jgi:hypothetical protein|nr:DUF2961 domain-containing protein [Candidatus Latescibacterota bacterium]